MVPVGLRGWSRVVGLLVGVVLVLLLCRELQARALQLACLWQVDAEAEVHVSAVPKGISVDVHLCFDGDDLGFVAL
jgi:hypothetical protein